METTRNGQGFLARIGRVYRGIDGGERLLPAGRETLTVLGWLVCIAALVLFGLRVFKEQQGVARQFQLNFEALYLLLALIHVLFLGLIGLMAVRRAKGLVADDEERYPASRVVGVVLGVLAEAAYLYLMYSAVAFVLIGMFGNGNEAVTKAALDHFDLVGALPLFGSVGAPAGVMALAAGLFFIAVAGLARVALYYLSECAAVLADIARNTTPVPEAPVVVAPKRRVKKGGNKE